MTVRVHNVAECARHVRAAAISTGIARDYAACITGRRAGLGDELARLLDELRAIEKQLGG